MMSVFAYFERKIRMTGSGASTYSMKSVVLFFSGCLIDFLKYLGTMVGPRGALTGGALKIAGCYLGEDSLTSYILICLLNCGTGSSILNSSTSFGDSSMLLFCLLRNPGVSEPLCILVCLPPESS